MHPLLDIERKEDPDRFLEYKTRRQQLLKAMPEHSIAVIVGEHIKFRNSDSEYPFRQNSDFYYLTGISEPQSVMVLLKEKEKTQFILFCLEKNPSEEVWTGPRIGTEAAISYFGADQSFEISMLDSMMPTLMQDKTHCVYSLGKDRAFDDRMLSWVNVARSKKRKGGEYPKIWEDIAHTIHELRLIKSPLEIALMRKAATISVDAHLRLMKSCKPKLMEYYLEAEFTHECIQAGARYMAYPPIVGSGKNTCILHYTQNNREMKSGEMVLVDAGCEFEGYASDITRTYPVNGRFTKEQRAIYELVLKAQQAAIALVRPGTRWDALQEVIVNIFIEGLLELNILQGTPEKLMEEKAYFPFYMHSSGHWLGLDVHDAGDYKKKGEWRPLEAGMVLTVEPGLYMGEYPEIDKKWWNIGVRIEDDVLVTEQGPEILSGKLPKTVDEIEAMMQKNS